MKCVLSIIVPVYNVEQYLKECLDSIVNLNLKGVEVVLVDDHSIDGSKSICSHYEEQYSNVKAYYLESNHGQSFARNYGLTKCCGKYVSFVDADDFIKSDSLFQICSYLNSSEVDIVLLNGYKYHLNGSVSLIDKYPASNLFNSQTIENVWLMLSNLEKFPGSACTKIFNRSFLLNNDIWFFNDTRYGEDLKFVITAFSKANSIKYFSIDYYYYRQNRNLSLTTSSSPAVFYDLVSFIEYALTLASGTNSKMIYSFAAYEYAMSLNSYSKLKGEEKRKALRLLKDYKWLLQFGDSKRLLIVKRLTSLLGINNTAKAIHLGLIMRNRINR